jgi:hypothetical protein
MNPSSLLITMIVISGIGSAICGITLIIVLRKMIARTHSASGTITNHEFRSFFGYDILGYFPGVEFTDSHCEKYYFVNRIGSWIPLENNGETVKVFYDPKNPSEAEIGSGLDGFFGRILLPVILGIMTIFLFFSSLFLSAILIISKAIFQN